MNENKTIDKIVEGSCSIKKTRFACNHQFGNSGDGRSKYNFPAGHRLHQHQRNTLAPTRQHDQISTVVERPHLFATHVPEQGDAVLEAILPDQHFQMTSLRPLAGNHALKSHVKRLQLPAGLDEECVILYGMKSSHRQQREAAHAPCDNSVGGFMCSGNSTPRRATTSFRGSTVG